MSVFFVNAATDGDAESQAETNSDDPCPITSEAQVALQSFWHRVMDDIKKIGMLDLKNQVLPLARIKKIMKLDEEVKMISAEAPMLFAKAAEIFIHELTLRAWVHTEDNKRRTLQRNDIAMAITKYDQFDFLIDIVPRDEVKPRIKEESIVRTSMNPEQVQYYFHLAQQHQAALQSNNGNVTSNSTATVVQQPTAPQSASIQIVQQPQVQTVQVPTIENTATTSGSSATAQQQQQVLLQTATTTNQNNAQTAAAPSIQIVQQLVTPSGEIQQIPIQLTPQQLQLIRNQMQLGSGQPIIIQTPIQAAAATPQAQIIQVAQQTTGPQPVYLTQANGTSETD